METENKIKLQRELLETIGRIHEKQGSGMIPGRILGLLMVMDQEKFTFDEIVEELQISKSSASHALRMLEARNFIEYTSVPGDRKRYFHLKTHDKFAIINQHEAQLRLTRDLFQSALELKSEKDSDVSVFLKDALELINIFLEKFEELKKDYSNKQ